MSHYDCPCMEKCPLHWAMSRIGGKWKVQILCSVANAGSIRYNTLRGKLDGISNTVLAAALLTDLSPVVFVAGAAALGIVIQNFIRRAK